MDPNLTVAHITHNTAVGLLHQGIAYPSPEWQVSPIRLPSASSAETCMAAATEVAIIAEKYLLDSTSLTNPQFAFCLFISGRMLLAHALHYNMALPSEFNSLTNSLMEISRRWNGPHAQPGSGNETDNLASKFAARLVQARDQGPNSLDIRQAAYSEEQTRDTVNTPSMQRRTLRSDIQDTSLPGVTHPHLNGILPSNTTLSQVGTANGRAINGDNTIVVDQEGSPDSISLAFPPLPLAFQPHYASATQTTMPSPVPQHMQQPSSFYGRQGEGGFESNTNYPDPTNMGYGGASNGFEDINSFFEYSFLPTQRISMFSGPNGKDVEQDQ